MSKQKSDTSIGKHLVCFRSSAYTTTSNYRLFVIFLAEKFNLYRFVSVRLNYHKKTVLCLRGHNTVKKGSNLIDRVVMRPLDQEFFDCFLGQSLGSRQERSCHALIAVQ